jgi:cytochrome c oxidase subunit 3
VNTLVLLASRLTMALAVHAAQTGNRRVMLLGLGLTALLGASILGLKGYEYYTDWRDGLVPLTGWGNSGR